MPSGAIFQILIDFVGLPATIFVPDHL